jgi:hypothetical protein
MLTVLKTPFLSKLFISFCYDSINASKVLLWISTKMFAIFCWN